MDELKLFTRTAHLVSSSIVTGLVCFNYFSDGKLHTYLLTHDSYNFFMGVISMTMFASGLGVAHISKRGKTLTD